MTIEIANALFGYLETLYNLNQKLVKLCGIDVIDDFEGGEKDILDICLLYTSRNYFIRRLSQK